MMESEASGLLNVPITDAEHRASQRSRSRSSSSHTLVPTPPGTHHDRDRQFAPQVGRFHSLRVPRDRYDDHDRQLYLPEHNSRPSKLPEIGEESDFSDHDDDEPKNQPLHSTTFPYTNNTAYQRVRSPPTAHQTRTTSQSFTPNLWQPIWLKKLPLVMITVLQLILIVALVSVCYAIDTAKGYRVTSLAQHYSWTFIPTLTGVILVSLWRQIDFHTKVLMPWKELSLGPLSPFETILVDYISEFRILSFLAAFKRLHRSVLVTSAAFLIAKCLTIAATGLFFVQTADLVDRFPTLVTSTFDSAALDPSILVAGSFPNTSVYVYYQTTVNGLGPQVGVDPVLAYLIPTLQSNSTALPPNSTFNATVDTFVPLASCRLANVTLNGEATIEEVNFPYNSTETPYRSPANITLTINEDDLCNSWPQLTFSGLDPLHYIVPERQTESKSQEVFCQADPSADPILLFSLIEITYSQELLTNVTRPEGGELPIALNTQRSVSRMVNVLCQADYTISQINVTNNTAVEGIAGISLRPLENPENRTLPGLSPSNMTRIFSVMLETETGLFTPISDPSFLRTPAFDLLAFAANATYDDFFDGNKLSDTALQVYTATMPEFVSKNLVSYSSIESRQTGLVASIAWTEERLYTNWTPVVLVVTGLGIMCLLTLVLILFVPRYVVPRDPNSIAAAATTLSRSPELNRLLRKLQAPQNKRIAAALNGYEVGTAIAVDETMGSKSFKIHVTEGRPQRDVEEIVPKLKFWNPVWISLPTVITTSIVPLMFIAILQVLQNMSDKNQGLMDVPDDRGTLVGSHYVPALVTLLIASIINNIDFYIALYSPWARLLKSRASAEHSILTSVMGYFAPITIRNAIRGRYWGALLSCVATIFAALLTVIVSGLYLVEHFETNGPTWSLSRLDNFNVELSSRYSVDNDNGAAAMLNLIQHNESSYPAFTLGEYAFPELALLQLQSEVKSGSRLVGSMEATLSALRGNLTCDAPTSYNISTSDSVVLVNASYELPATCQNGIDSLGSPSVAFSTNFRPTQGQSEFGGRLFDLRFGTNSSKYGNLGEANSSFVGNNPAVGCPSLVFVWGNFALEINNKNEVNIAVCYQRLQSVDVNVTMQQNTTTLGPWPPRPDEGSVKPQTNPNGSTDVFDFRIQNNLARQLGSYIGQNPNIDPFFQSMINGSIRMDTTNLTSNRSIGLMGISHTYRLYMAQVVNAIMREPIAGQNATLRARQQPLLQDVRTTVTISRLVQDNTSKNILHALLATCALLVLGGYLLTKTRNVLPCNPCSIAGTMSLLAGSNMCSSLDSGKCECCGKVRRSFRSADGDVQVETIHAGDNEDAENEETQFIGPGAEWMDDKTFARIFEGRNYSLGWWPADKRKSQTKRYGVDYGDVQTMDEGGDWYLGRRKNSETFEIFADQVTQAEGRGRTRAFSDVNERGSYRRAEPSPGVEAYEMRNMAMQGSPGRTGRYGDD